MIRRLKKAVKRKSQEEKLGRPGQTVKKRKFREIKGFEVFLIRELCRMLKIEVPIEYEESRNRYVSGTDLFDSLENKEEALSKIVFIEERDEEKYKASRKSAKKFKRLYYESTIIEHSDTDLLKMFVQWHYVFAPLGFSTDNYFDYRLNEKSIKEAQTFVDKKFERTRLVPASISEGGIIYTKDKSLFNKTFPNYVQRDYIDMTNATFEEFKEFIDKNPKFFAKPLAASLGMRTRIVLVDEFDGDDQELFNYCKEGRMIIEELIDQHPALSSLNPESVNSMRINALYHITEEVTIVSAILRIGRSGSIIDNITTGGIAAIIDLKTGKISVPAIDKYDKEYIVHPDSGVEVVGFSIPHWGKVVNAIKESAAMMPKMRHIGWDVTVTEAGDVELIEGNSRANFRMMHRIDQIGKKPFYEKFVEEIEDYKRKHPGAIKEFRPKRKDKLMPQWR